MADTDQYDYKSAIKQIEKTIAALQPPKMLLLVDDDAADVFIILKKLERFNVRVDVAGDGKAAQELMTKTRYDIVMFDLVMPGMSGLDLILQTTGLNPGTRYVLLTGYPTNHQVDAVLRQGAIMLSKPLDDHALEAVLPQKIQAV